MKTIQQIITELEQYDCSPFYKEKAVDYKGTTVTFVPWYDYPPIFNKVCEGMWSLESDTQEFSDAIVVTCRISITGLDSNGNVATVVRESAGSSGKNDSAYGGAIFKAKAQALRRASAMFGLSLKLWSKPETDKKKSGGYNPPGKVSPSTFNPVSNSPSPSLASLKKSTAIKSPPKSETKVDATFTPEPNPSPIEVEVVPNSPDVVMTDKMAEGIPF